MVINNLGYDYNGYIIKSVDTFQVLYVKMDGIAGAINELESKGMDLMKLAPVLAMTGY